MIKFNRSEVLISDLKHRLIYVSQTNQSFLTQTKNDICQHLF